MSHARQVVRAALRMSGTVHRQSSAVVLPTLPPPSAVLQHHRILHSSATATATPSYSSRRCLSTSSSEPSSEPSPWGRDLLTAATIQYVEDDLEIRSLIQSNPNKLIVIDWFATWCGPCRAIAPLYEQLSAEMKDVVFISADIEELPDASAQAGVQSVPCFHFIKNNELVAVLTGADENKLRKLVEQHK